MNNRPIYYIYLISIMALLLFMGKCGNLCAQDHHKADSLKKAYLSLSKMYEQNKNYGKALENYSLHLKMKDSLSTLKIKEEISNQEKKLSLSGKENERKVLEKENQIKEVLVQHQKEKSRKQKLIMGLAVGVIILLLLLSYIAFRGYSLKKRANLLINMKNKTIEDQQEQITENIEYARNLQRNIMVTEEKISNDLADCLLINKPRNIVSGDFHWYKKIQDRIFISMIDCTGHGVPGALTSIIGNNQMHNIINEDPLMSPGEVLSKLHSKIITTLKGEDESREVNTGMEMAVCIIDKKAKLLTYAGANMPLFILRGDHIEEIGPTKQGIGYSAFFRKALKDIEFENNTIKLEDDTSYYMVTDGIIDQFDHNDKNKYGKQRLLELLIKTSKQVMASQKQEIISNLNIWKGETPQTDDVSLVGFRV